MFGKAYTPPASILLARFCTWPGLAEEWVTKHLDSVAWMSLLHLFFRGMLRLFDTASEQTPPPGDESWFEVFVCLRTLAQTVESAETLRPAASRRIGDDDDDLGADKLLKAITAPLPTHARKFLAKRGYTMLFLYSTTNHLILHCLQTGPPVSPESPRVWLRTTRFVHSIKTIRILALSQSPSWITGG